MPAPLEFEPEIEFPAHPFNAARVFLAVLAYPERGAGQPGGLGIPFVEALWQYPVWSGRKAKGLRRMRELFGNPELHPPKKREFEGALSRGLKRIDRRNGAYGLIGTQMVNGFFAVRHEVARLVAEGRRAEALAAPEAKNSPAHPALWLRNTPTPLRVVEGGLDRWSGRFELNRTGQAADSEQKAKDLIRRAYIQSRPVLHMAHALNMVHADIGPKLFGWKEGADKLLVLLFNSDKWTAEAIDIASRWRSHSGLHPALGLQPEDMVSLVPPKKWEIMHPEQGRAVAP